MMKISHEKDWINSTVDKMEEDKKAAEKEMNNDLREQAIGKPPFYHMHDGKPCYLDGAGIRHEVPPELITLILDEALSAVRAVNPDGGLFPKAPERVHRECIEAIDNMRDNDD